MGETQYDKLRHRDLEQIALILLRCARLLIESGSRCHVVHSCAETLARVLGADILGMRVGYASVGITLGSGANTITRMVTVTQHGVDQRLAHAVRALVHEAAAGRLPPGEIGARLATLETSVRRYPPWLVALAVGLACWAFGELLGADHAAGLPILVGGAIGQMLRVRLRRAGVNPYVVVVAVALVGALACGIGARLAGSGTVDLAMVAATLLLVPGVPATNAQANIMDGYPTLGSAQAVSVTMTMVFVATGLWLAQLLHGLVR
jgi:uncharacterized membrane protein YjjP (DUF1212 family)